MGDRARPPHPHRVADRRRAAGRAPLLELVFDDDDVGAIHLLPVDGVPFDLAGTLTCDWRAGEVW